MLAAAWMRSSAQFSLVALAALPLLFHPCLARADATPSHSSAPVAVVALASDRSLQPTFLSVSLNGTPVSDGTELLSDASRKFFICSLDLAAWRIATPSTAPLDYAARQWYPLASFGGVAFVDMSTASIDITVPAASFSGSRADLSASLTTPAAAAGLAATSIGYDARAEFSAGKPVMAGFLSADHSYPSGSSLQISGIARSAGGSAFTRLGTTWERDDPASMTALKIGDAVTHAGTLGVPTLFAGVSWGTDFNTAPGFITFPLPTVSGIATLPSTFSVVANGINTGNGTLQPGPFDLSGLNVVNGQGQVSVAVTDLLGRTEVITQDYYAAVDLLKKGLTRRYADVGFPRYAYGVKNASYGNPVASVGYERGVTDSFTLGTRAEVQTTGATLEGSSKLALGKVGVIDAAAAASSGTGTAGEAYSYGYTFVGRRLNFGLDWRSATPRFSEIGLSGAPGQMLRQSQASIAFDAGRGNQFSAAYGSVDALAQPTTKFVSVGWSVQTPGGNLTTSLIHPSGGRAVVSLTFIKSFGPHTSIATSASVIGSAARTLNVNDNYRDGFSGMSYALNAVDGPGAWADLSVGNQTSFGLTTADFIKSGSSGALTLGASGAVIFADGDHFATRSSGESFGVAEIPGYPGVTVYQNGLPVATTDARGNAVLPQLLPFQKNVISVDESTIAAQSNIGAPMVTVTPYRGAAVAAKFKTARPGGVLVRMRGADGRALPAGTRVEYDDSYANVADDGYVYLVGVMSGHLVITSTDSGTLCQAAVEIPDVVTTMPDIGIASCVISVVKK